MNLVLCLLSTRQFLPAERIRRRSRLRRRARTDDAFFRMFERDKTELRELGVPLETGRNSVFDTADGYRIARQDYELGEIDLDPTRRPRSRWPPASGTPLGWPGRRTARW